MTNNRLTFGTIEITDVAKQHIKDCIDTNWITMGPKTLLFEEKWKEVFEVRYASAVSSGTDALICMLSTLYDIGGIRGQSEIIVPALSFIATHNAILAAGFKIVPVDVNLDDMLMDVNQLESKITKNTIAVLYPTLMGVPGEVAKIREICDKHNLFFLIDNCEAHLCVHQGYFMEDYADAAAYSAFAAHVVAASELGVVTTNQRWIDSAVKSIRSHGRRGGALYFDFQRFGLNCKPTDIDASLGLGALEIVDWTFSKRKANFYKIRESMIPYEDLAWFTTEKSRTINSPHAFSITLKQPDNFAFSELTKALDNAKIDWKRNFGAFNRHFAFKDFSNQIFPNAEHIGNFGLHIGIHAYLSAEDTNYIIKILDTYFTKYSNLY